MMTPPWAVTSPIRAAGKPPISTVGEAFTITSGGPTHTAISVIRAAGNPIGQSPLYDVLYPKGIPETISRDPRKPAPNTAIISLLDLRRNKRHPTAPGGFPASLWRVRSCIRGGEPGSL